MSVFTAACLQLNASGDMTANLRALEARLREAAHEGAVFIATPENSFLMQEPGKPLQSPEAGVALCQSLARELNVWILMGSALFGAPDGKAFNRSLLLNDHGHTVAQYNKIHLFDVTLKNGETYRESDRIDSGSQAVMATTPWGKLGMTVCYDLRFAQLYRALAQAGAEFFTVPSAFTYTTGSAHWHALLRARAIETGSFVLAPAQCGMHPGKRRTFGHALIVGPWGEILAEAGEDAPGLVTATIDMSKVAEARAMIPSLTHDRGFGITRY